MSYIKELYAATNEAPIYEKIWNNKSSGRPINKILMGTWVGVKKESGDWYEVTTAGPDGWIHKDDVRKDMGLKAFYVDVAQGDGVLLEIDNKRVIIDGGPNSNFYNFLKWQYSYLINKGETVYIDYMIISHFDDDHFKGLIPLIKDENFKFGKIYHNGIARFYTSSDIRNGKKRPPIYNEDLGTVKKIDGKEYLSTSFSTIADIEKLQGKKGLKYRFSKFCEAVIKAEEDGRLGSVKKLEEGDSINLGNNHGAPAEIEILGPVPTKIGNKKYFKWFTDSSHTRNGHSVVAKLSYGKRTMLFGGDLNSQSERHLMQHFVNNNPFRVDVAKQCHHGSSDFTVDFMKLVKPYVTVISSGDNESHSHPRADAVGCAGRYSRGARPKVFSTELARSVSTNKEDILYGLINLRTDGEKLYMAQMKESSKDSDRWDSYKIF